MLVPILSIVCVLYLLLYGVFSVGQRRTHRLRRSVPDVYPRISIVVAARNEEPNIGDCLDHLMRQDYPADRCEVIAVNDDSEDRTLEIMEAHARASGGRLKVFSTHPEQTHALGKARAIAQGLDQATGEIILLTDADCFAAPQWARSVVEHFNPEVDVYGGFAIVRPDNLFATIQMLDWIHLHSLGSAAAGLGHPVGVIGNNFAFRRSAYDAVGGYRAVRFTVTEDFALFQAMYRNGSRVIFPCSADTSMVTLPCPTLHAVIKQKQRWSRGGTDSDYFGLTIFGVTTLMIIAVSVAPFVSPAAWLMVWGTKFFCDLIFLTPNLQRLGRLRSTPFLIFFEFYFLVQLLVIPLLLTRRNVVWKGREYRS
jgi:cellulose synthase/poly-beta-1,6-N-acetylglucosamine synthase-like glycosyltransferase